MRNKLKLFPLLALAALTACTTTKIVEVPVKEYVVVETYPDLPPINIESLGLEGVTFDVHRDKAGKQAPSNLYVGVDKENYDRLLMNNAKVAERESLFSLLIEMENKRRDEWRQRSEAAKLRAGAQDE